MNETGGERRHGEGSGFSDGIRTGIGVLHALKDALEETVREAVDRGDLGADRAREAVREAMTRAQHRFDEARESFDLVPRREFERLREEVEALRARVDRLEGSGDDGGEGAGSGSDGGIIVDVG